MSTKKGLVGKEGKPAAGGAKPGLAKSPVSPGKPVPGGAKFPAKEMPAKGGPARNLLSVEDVAERLRVDPGHVQHWLREGWLRGSAASGIQLYEMEKFRAKHHNDVQAAQNSAPPAGGGSTRPSPRAAAAPVNPRPKAAAPEREVKNGPSPLTVIKGAFALFGSLFQRSKHDKIAPYTDPLPDAAAGHDGDGDPTLRTARLSGDAYRSLRPPQTPPTPEPASELTPPPPPSTEVWPSLEQMHDTSAEAPVPDWLKSDAPAASETLVMRADDILGAVKHAVTPQKSGDEKQRNQELLQQLQEQRRVELELQDEIETLRQRLDLSLTSEREVRTQLKRARQELQVALEELEQRSPEPAADSSQSDEWRKRYEQLEADRAALEDHLEQVRSQAEEFRQHGLQWHQLATQAEHELQELRQASGQTEQLQSSLQAARQRLEASERERTALQARASELEAQLKTRTPGASADELRARERTIAELQGQLEAAGARWTQAQTQSRSQSQRWEQELQASASWVQKLTAAVSQRDKRIADLEANLSVQASAAPPKQSEEELKSQVMSLRVELNSLRRNYEIVSLQAKTMEGQLQQARRQMPSAPAAPPAAAVPPPMQPLARDSSSEEEGAFRRRLNARLRSLSSPGSSVEGGGLEPPPFLELDPTDS